MEIKNKNILVTGGAGFIGGHLVEKLIDLQAKVSVIDIAVDHKSYFAQNELQKKCKLSLIDIRDKKKVENYFSKNKIDYIFHLAAEPIVEKAFENPYSTLDTNIMGTVNILEGLRKNKKIKALIAASSDKAYGKTEKSYTEESPLKGDHPYDVSKSAADLICQTYYKTYNCPVVITRFGNVYGEGDLHLNRIVPGILQAIIENKTLMIRSNGKYIRDYLYVKDVADGYIFLLKNLAKAKGQAFNFASKDTLSVLDLIRKAEKILKTKINHKILNNAQNEIPYQHLNDNKIRKMGWKTVHDLNNSLSWVLDWYKDLLHLDKKNNKIDRMRPKNLKTKIFLDSGDPGETKKIIKKLGFLDGQTTNPSLIAKNPEVVSQIKKGKKFTKKEIYAFYKKTIREISEIIPEGSVSVEVYVDSDTTAPQILKETKEMFSWVKNAHVKIPITKEGLIAAHQAVKEGIRVNMTLCFSQEQAAAVSLATKEAAKKGDVFISPFIGRLEDIDKDGLSLISNILRSYKGYKDNKVEVLAASVRGLPHFMSSLAMGCDIVTASFATLSEWADMGCPVPDGKYKYKRDFKIIPYKKILSPSGDWKKINLEDKLTEQGIEKFCADWENLIA